MKIALIGYGKMGRAIEQIALQRGHIIVLKIDHNNVHEMTAKALQQADVAIEFTNPEAAPGNVSAALKAGVSVVCGTTGWNDHLPEAQQLCRDTDTAFLQASNFSVGVNIFFEVNKALAAWMNAQPDYDVTIEEVHHTQKKDAPSGTAITLAEQILLHVDRKTSWALRTNDANAETLAITALREEGVPGTHRVSYTSPIDTIDIIHTAHSREGFARGAVLAAEFIAGKKGIYTMQDVLGIG